MQQRKEAELEDTNKGVHVLHLEDDPNDIEIIRELLRRAGIQCEITDARTRVEFEGALTKRSWDLILADFALPAFDGLSALDSARQLCPNTPFIFVTGTMGEENAVESLKSGATDYVLKGNLARLGPSVMRALKERRETLSRLKTEQTLEEKEEQLRFLAYHDALTGLPNRALLLVRLPDILASARRRGEKVAVLFIDLDHFKVINDSLGHSTGDLVLKAAGRRLAQIAREDDVVARLGGDEFILVLGSVRDSSDAAMASDRINKALAGEIRADARTLTNTCSIGISIFPENGDDAETLIENSDAALYAAKEKGRNTWQFFTLDMNRRALERLTLENGLRRALDDDQFFVEYQPQVDALTGHLTGAEALLRWRHPELGIVPPGVFIPIAENTGDIIRVGEWVLKTACAQAKKWMNHGMDVPLIAINVSAVQLRHPQFLETVKSALAAADLKPTNLELEVTESQLIQDKEISRPLLSKLEDMGVSLAMDDFGTGYCGLSYLRDFHFAKVKIDRTFVRSILVDPRDAALTSAIITLAKTLHMRVLAECVETIDQLEFLKGLGCEQIQGNFISPPMSVTDFSARVAAQGALSRRRIPEPTYS